MCACVGLHACACTTFSDFTACVFTWLHLALIGKCDSDFTHSHKNTICAMLCYSLWGEIRGYNRKHMWMVIRAHCIAIRLSTNSAHTHAHALILCAVYAVYSYKDWAYFLGWGGKYEKNWIKFVYCLTFCNLDLPFLKHYICHFTLLTVCLY